MIPVQVEATGRDGIDIPDHEVITRRKQFRMKRNRAEDKRQKKEENSKKKAAKAHEPPKKRGRKAVEKAEPWKEKGRRNDRKNKKQPKIPASSSKGPDCHSRKMKRYRKLAQTLKESNDAVAPVMSSKLAKMHSQTSSKDTKASRKDMEQQHVLDSRVEDSKDPKNEEISQTKIKGEGKKTAAKSKAKQQQKPMHQHDTPPASAKEKTKRTTTAKAKATPKAKSSTKPSKPDVEDEKKGSRKRKNKQCAEKNKHAEKPKRTRAPRKIDPSCVNQEMKNQVIQTLKECKSTNCTHPSVKMIRKPHVDIEPYRTRNACGIKVARSFFSSDKAKGSGKAHVTYFSGQTPCFYSNFKLAELWVSRLQACSWMIDVYQIILVWFYILISRCCFLSLCQFKSNTNEYIERSEQIIYRLYMHDTD